MRKPDVPRGMRDFSPEEMARRNYIFGTIRSVYELYGFRQIETPAMETLGTLLGKYGEEGDRLLYRVLNSGDFLRGLDDYELLARDPQRLSSRLCEKGLRYDLTVPFARYVVMHRDELQMPFKRYQIQPVWRADRPQRGRYREFCQCDADVVGSDSLLNEAELVQIIDEVFTRLGLGVQVKVNNRKVLAGLAERVGEADRIVDITVAMDKLDKIGVEGVEGEMRERGVGEAAIAALEPLLTLEADNGGKMDLLEGMLKDSEMGLRGLWELRQVLSMLDRCGMRNEVQLDVTLARGLNYYTGAILEVKALGAPMGSIAGGGRYDNLTGIFGMPGLSGVGISFGADRIYDVLLSLGLFPEDAMRGTRLMFANFGQEEMEYCLPIAARARAMGVATEVYPDPVKMKRQMGYANSKGIRFVAIAGESEIAQGKVTLKDMETGEQDVLTPEELLERVG